MDLKSVRVIFAMVSCKQYPIMVDETANFLKKKRLTIQASMDNDRRFI